MIKKIFCTILAFILTFQIHINSYAANNQKVVIFLAGFLGTEIYGYHNHNSNNISHISWDARKSRFGSIKNDMTGFMYMDQEGYPLSKPNDKGIGVKISDDNTYFMHYGASFEGSIGDGKMYYLDAKGNKKEVSKNPSLLLGKPVSGDNGNEYYGPIMKMLNELEKKDPNTHVYFYGYDWRRGNAWNAERLEIFVNYVTAKHGVSKVDLIGHSMGGLVATYYINNPFTSTNHKVDKFISLGTPYLGAPKSVYQLETGENMNGLGTGGVNNVLKDVAANINSSYQLLPPKSFFNITNQNYIKNENTKQDIPSNSTSYNYLETKNFLLGRSWINKNLFEKAENFHDNLNVLNALNKVDSYAIIGYGLPTVTQVLYKEGKGGSSKYKDKIVGDGDGTVPLLSAGLINVSSNKTLTSRLSSVSKIYYVEGEHAGMLAIDDVLTLLANILNGNPDNVPSSIKTNLTDIKKPASDKGYLSIYADCPIELHIYDESGNHNGLTDKTDDENIFENNIPLSTFDVSETDTPNDFNYKSYLNNKEYDLKILGTDNGEMDLEISLINSDFEFTKKAVFNGVPITTQTIITCKTKISESITNDEIFLNLDTDSDGVIDEVIKPSFVLIDEAANEKDSFIYKITPDYSTTWSNHDVNLEFLYNKENCNIEYSINNNELVSYNLGDIIEFKEEGEYNISSHDSNITSGSALLVNEVQYIKENDKMTTQNIFIGIDKTPPVIISNILEDSIYGINQSVTFNYELSDNFGIESHESNLQLESLLDTSSEGNKQIKIIATDYAGNISEKIINYVVKKGYLDSTNKNIILEPPIKNTDTFIEVKKGQSLPVKFSLQNYSEDSNITANLFIVSSSDGKTETVKAVSKGNSNNDNTFRKAGKDKFIFNLDTSNIESGYYKLRIDLSNGTKKYISIYISETGKEFKNSGNSLDDKDYETENNNSNQNNGGNNSNQSSNGNNNNIQDNKKYEKTNKIKIENIDLDYEYTNNTAKLILNDTIIENIIFSLKNSNKKNKIVFSLNHDNIFVKIPLKNILKNKTSIAIKSNIGSITLTENLISKLNLKENDVITVNLTKGSIIADIQINDKAINNYDILNPIKLVLNNSIESLFNDFLLQSK